MAFGTIEQEKPYSHIGMPPYEMLSRVVFGDNFFVKSPKKRAEILEPTTSTPEFKVLEALNQVRPNPEFPPDFDSCQWDDELKMRAEVHFFLNAIDHWSDAATAKFREARKFRKIGHYNKARDYERIAQGMLLTAGFAQSKLDATMEDLSEKPAKITEGESLVLLTEVAIRAGLLSSDA